MARRGRKKGEAKETDALLILPLVLTRFLAYQKRVHPPSILSPSPAAVILALHPLVFFYGFLYYTDVPSLLAVVTTIVLAQEEKPWLAALVRHFSLLVCLALT